MLRPVQLQKAHAAESAQPRNIQRQAYWAAAAELQSRRDHEATFAVVLPPSGGLNGGLPPSAADLLRRALSTDLCDQEPSLWWCRCRSQHGMRLLAAAADTLSMSEKRCHEDHLVVALLQGGSMSLLAAAADMSSMLEAV